jgi:formylglycine-generating enzyme required for sulfatase activity
MLLFSWMIIITTNLSAKDKSPFIPNTTAVYQNVYMSHTEVTNIMYHEFLSYQKSRISAEDYVALLPDTTVWRSKNSYSEPYVEYYFRHPAYNEYPIVGLTKLQAEKFCAWLSIILTEENRKKEDSNVDSVLVRLPTNAEWVWAAKGGNEYYEYPWEGHNMRMEEGKFQGQIRANFVRGKGDFMGMAGSLNDHADITAPVKSYWPNDFGLYNCAGNVAEMVADKDVAKGGSWYSSGYDIRVNSEIPFTEPSSKIGFRYLVEVKKLKPESTKKTLKIDKKWFNKNFVMLGDTMYVQKYEVSNELYNLFIKESGRQVQDTLLWNAQFPYSDWYTNNYRWHDKYANYPAVGMSRKDTEEFSNWMAGKLGFLDIEFSIGLPNEKDWIGAARGGLDLSPYPWGGPYVRNSKGFLLANYRYVPESFSSRNRDGEWQVTFPEGRHEMFGADFDQYLATGPVDAYNPNGLGLFNMAGNVREMILTNGLTKGGGWKSIDYYLQVSCREFWDEKPSAEVGFRVVVKKD